MSKDNSIKEERIKKRTSKILLTLLLITISTTSNLYSQVTIGSIEPANDGALLDLKEFNSISKPSANSTKGLALPRVSLTDANNLYPMFRSNGSGGYVEGVKATEDLLHTGLLVYNTETCTLYGPGLYIWNGKQWKELNKENIGLNIDSEYLDLPSGKDARPLTAQVLNLSWISGKVEYQRKDILNGGVPFTTNPLPTSPLTSSPTSINLLPDAMSSTQVTASNPWYSKETKLLLCGQGKEIILNQTNYALQVNNSFSDSQLLYTGTESIPIKGNTSWTTKLLDPLQIIDTTTPTIESNQGTDKKDGTTASLSFSFTMRSSATRHTDTKIIFSDAETPERFNDITVSILNCSGDHDPDIYHWAMRAGFSPPFDNTNPTKDVPNPTTGIAWHLDQDDNIFLSADFGAGGRWMITNLAAKSFAQTNRTAIDNTVFQQLPATPTNTENYINPQWCYPKGGSNGTDATSYNKFERLGILYNWAAATNMKGGSVNGLGDIWNPDGTGKAVSNCGFPESSGLVADHQVRIQGICPNGWHLPSSAQWANLFNEIQAHTSTYSSMNDAGGTPMAPCGFPSVQFGKSMVDYCEYISTFLGNGLSNTINTISHPGFNAILTGRLKNGSTTNENTSPIWGSSTYGGIVMAAWIYNNSTSVSLNIGRAEYLPVRCQKDY